MSKIIKINDNISTSDQQVCSKGLVGEWIFGKGLKQVPFIDPFGKKCFRSEFEEELYRKHNVVVIGGYQYVFSKLFNIKMDTESTLRVGNLNDDSPQMKIGVSRADYISDKYTSEFSLNSNVTPVSGVNISALNHIFGFIVGDGGATENNLTVIAPDYKRRTLFRAVPFRMSNDGTEIDQSKYFGKATTLSNDTSSSVTSYYIKKFDPPAPHIVHAWASTSTDELQIVDDSVYSSVATTPIESYVEMTMSLDKNDIRGFFTTTNSVPRINEFGLVSGWYNSEKNDYEQIVMFSHFTRMSILFDQEDEIKIIYRLYAR